MKKIWKWIVDFTVSTWEPRLLISLLVFLVVTITLNYIFDFEDSYLDSFQGRWIRWPMMAAMQAFPFLFVCFLLYLLKIKSSWLQSRDFWVCTVAGFIIIGFDRSFTGFSSWINQLPREDYYFYFRFLSRATSILTLILPLLLFYLVYERRYHPDRTYYGLSKGRTDLRPYFLLLGIACLCIALGSFFNDIRAYYPRYAVSGGNSFARAHDLPEFLVMIVYEVAYGSSFVGVELFFRGFLIMSFSRTLGPYAVWAMVPSYAFLHFGKPLPETISSIFGGYILGIITYKTRNIHGGIIIHVGIAWFMELVGHLQRL